MLTLKEANEAISDLVSKAHLALKEAEDIADEHKIEFTFSLAYPGGLTYYPYGDDSCYEGWTSSSSIC